MSIQELERKHRKIIAQALPKQDEHEAALHARDQLHVVQEYGVQRRLGFGIGCLRCFTDYFKAINALTLFGLLMFIRGTSSSSRPM